MKDAGAGVKKRYVNTRSGEPSAHARAEWRPPGLPSEKTEAALTMADVLYVLLTVGVFGVLALTLRGLERL